jgi:hypothetical protein
MSDEITPENYEEMLKELEKKESAEDVASMNKATQKVWNAAKKQWEEK